MRWRRSKYGAKKTKVDGYTFDSKAEAHRYTALRLMQMAGAISKLTVHPSYELQAAFKCGGKTIRAIHYEADFDYIDHEKSVPVAEDVKGVRTEVFRVKEKLFRFKYPYIDLRIIDVRRGKR